MKNSLLLFTVILAVFFTRCGDPNAHEDSSDSTGHHHDHEQVTDNATETSNSLVLNNGKKWEADDATMSNVSGMQSIVTEFKTKNTGTLEEYVALGNKLQDSIGVMINECRMGGPDHEALHLWLEPYMQHVDELSQATAAPDAESVFHTIETHLNEFNNFFE